MNKAIMFILGAATGSLLTYAILDKKYKKIADDEIEAIKNHYKKKEETMNKLEEFDHIHAWKDTPIDMNIEENKVKKEAYTTMLNDLGYTEEEMKELQEEPGTKVKYTTDGYEVFIEPEETDIEPYVISPEEYGEYDDYETKSWAYYSGNGIVVTDEDGQIVDDVEMIIGDGLDHFGEFEEDSVCVRNENLKCDYQILNMYKSYDDVIREDA